MSTESIDTTREHNRRRILDHVDQIVADSPRSNALLPNGIYMEFCVGRRSPRAEGEEPTQIIISRVRSQGAQHRLITVASRVLSAQWPSLIHIEDGRADDLIAHEPIGADAVEDLDLLLRETDFDGDDGAATRELQARLETEGRYARWVEVMLDPVPLVDLV